MRKDIETSSKTRAEAEVELAKDLEEMREDSGKKTKECAAVKAKAGELKKGLATLCDAPSTSEKTEKLESRDTSDAKAIAHLEMLVTDHRWSSFRVVAENGAIRRKVNDMEGKSLKAVSSAEQLQTKVSAMAEKQDSPAAKCESFLWMFIACPAWPKRQRVYVHVGGRWRKRLRQRRQMDGRGTGLRPWKWLQSRHEQSLRRIWIGLCGWKVISMN